MEGIALTERFLVDGSFPIPIPELIAFFLGVVLGTPIGAVAVLGSGVLGFYGFVVYASMVTRRRRIVH